MVARGESLTLIRAGRVIDSRGRRPIANGAVLVAGSRIMTVGPASKVVPPEGAPVTVLDYPRMTAMPGMVDCHTHHNGFGDGRGGDDLALLPDEVLALQSARNARASLFSGVTTIRENGPKAYTMLRLRDAVNAGVAIGPRMVLCGWPVTIIGGHLCYFGSEVTGPVETRAMTRRLIAAGADYIKITATGGTTRTSFPLRHSFNVEELRAITEQAHDLGKLTAAHCTSTQGVVNCLDAGVDMIIHCIFREADGTDLFREDVAERIGRQGAYVNPTLHVQRANVWGVQQDAALRNFEQRLKDCRRMVEMGLKMVTGSDSSWGYYQLGNTVYEVECLALAGLSPMQAIRSVTADAAAALGVDHLVGTLEPGKEADIIVVDGDPSRDVSALWKVMEVFLAGRRIDRGSETSRASIRQHPPGAVPAAR